MVAKQEGKVLMAKVDIDDHTDLAIEYEVGTGRTWAFLCQLWKERPSVGRGVPTRQQCCWGGEAQCLQVPHPSGLSLVSGFHCLAFLWLVFSIPTCDSAEMCPLSLARVCQCKCFPAVEEPAAYVAFYWGCSGAGWDSEVTSPSLFCS